MLNQGLSKIGLRVLDRLTDRYPTVVPRVFERAFLAIAGSAMMHRRLIRSQAQLLRRVKRFEKILVSVDVNIGDAVIMQTAVRTLRALFPDAEIDYACNAAGATLVEGMPEIRTVYSVFTTFAIPSDADHAKLRGIVERGQYDVIINMCAFLQPKKLHATCPVIPLYLAHASSIVGAWDRRRRVMHISPTLDVVLREIAAEAGVGAPATGNAPLASSIYLSEDAVREAHAFLASHNLHDGRRLALIHADAPFRYTQIPVPMLQELLRLMISGSRERILLSTGSAGAAMAADILNGLRSDERGQITVVPRMSIAGYAALIDACDLFVSADTGPMHIAAATKRRRSGASMRNRTALVAIYGATDTQMSGYDAFRPWYLAGGQDAPAKTFAGSAPCRNVSCLNKPGKTCAVVRCFDGLQARDVAAYINAYFAMESARVRGPEALLSAAH